MAIAVAKKDRRQRRSRPELALPPRLASRSPALSPFTAARAANPSSNVIADSEYVARRVKRHLNDLERTNYTEPTTGPSAYGEAEDDAKGPTALGKEEDASGERSSRLRVLS